MTRGTIKRDARTLLQVKKEGLSHGVETFKGALSVFAKLLSQKGVTLTFRGMECYTTGKQIVIPELGVLVKKHMTAEEIVSAQEFLEAVRGFVIHEVGHVLYTDFKAVEEASRRDKGPILKHIWNALEDPFVERKMVADWPGAGVSLDNMNTWSERSNIEKIKNGEVNLLAQVVLGVTLVAKLGTNHWFYKELPEEVKTILKHLGPEVAKVREIKNSWETLAVATDLLDKIEKMTAPPPPPPPQPQEDDDEEQQPGGGGSEEDEEQEDGESEESDEEPEEDSPAKGDADDEEDGEEGEEPEEEEEEGSDDDDDSEQSSMSHGDEGDDFSDEGEEEDDETEGNAGSGDEDEDDDEEGEGSGGSDDDEEESEDDLSDTEATSGEADGEDTDEEESDEPLDDSLRNALKDDLANEDETAKDIEKTDKGKDLTNTLKGGITQIDPRDFERYMIYTTENDKVETPEFNEATRRQYVELQRSLRDPVEAGKRQLANLLRARTLSYDVHDLEEGSLDRSRLYRFASGTAANVFKQSVQHEDLKGVSCSLVVNLSGSMTASVMTTKGFKSRIDLAKEATLIFAEVLDAIHVPFEVFGHSTGLYEGGDMWNRASPEEHKIFTRWGATILSVYKTFDESWRRVGSRIMQMKTLNNTHDGEVLGVAAERIMKARPTDTRRVIFMIDDGEPHPNIWDFRGGSWWPQQDKDYDTKNVLMQRHQDYLKEQVKRVTARGVEVIGIGMGTNSVESFYPDHLVVNDVSEFSKLFMTKMREVLLPKRR